MDRRDALLEAVARAVTTANPDLSATYAKKALVLLWEIMPYRDRRRFLGRIDEADLSFITFGKRWPDRDDATLEAAANHWPYVMATLQGRDLDFARSIAKALRQKRKISDKQAGWMKRLYSDYKTYKDIDGQVIE